MRLNNALKNMLLLSALLGSGSAQAFVCTWIGANSSGWIDNANWSCTGTGGGPANGDDLVFPDAAGNKVHAHSRKSLTSVNSITINGCGYNITGPLAVLNVSSSNPISVACNTQGASNALNIQNLVLTSAPPIRIQQQTTSMSAGNVSFDLALTNAMRWSGKLDFVQTQPGLTQPIIRVRFNESAPSPSNEITITGGRVIFPSANDYSGLTTVVSGELQVLNSSGLGASGSAASGTIVRSNGMLTKAIANIFGELLTLDDNLNAPGVPDPMLFASSDGNWSGAITLSGPVNGALQPAGALSSNSGTIWSISGPITGPADIVINAKGISTALSLTGANSYTGSTRILNFGRLTIGAQSERIPDTSVVDIESGGRLDFLPQIVSATETIGGLSGLGDIGFGDAQPSPRLFINVANGQSYDFGGTIADLGSGSIPVGITGPGTQIISGTATTQAPFNLRNNAIFDVRGTLFPIIDLGNSAILQTGSLGKVLGVRPFTGVVTAARIRPGGPSGGFGILEISGSSVLLHPNMTLDFDIAGNVPGSNQDQIKAAASGLTVELANAQLMVSITSDLSPGESAVLIDADTINGTFNGYPEGSLYPIGAAPVKYVVSYVGGKFTLSRPTAITLSPSTLSGTIGQALSAPALTAMGGLPPYTIALYTGPAWLMGAQSVNTITLSGTVAGPIGPQGLNIYVADSAGQISYFARSIEVSAAAAGDYSWTGSIDSEWGTPMNWMPDGPPTAASIVRFPSGPSNKVINNVPTISLDYLQITDGYNLTGSGLMTLTNANPIRFTGATSSPTRLLVPMFLSAPTALVSATTVDPADSTLRLGSGNGTLDFAGNIKFTLANSLPGDTGTGRIFLEPYLKDTTASTGTVTYERATGANAHQVRLLNNTFYSGDTIINGPFLQVSALDLTAPFGNSGGITQTSVFGAAVILDSSGGDYTIPNERLTLNLSTPFGSLLSSRAPSSSVIQTWMGEIVVPSFATIAALGGKLRLNNAISGGGSVQFSGDNAVVLDAACSVGDITIRSGATLLLANSELIPNSSSVSLEGNARFDLNGNEETIAALSGPDGQSLVDVAGNPTTKGRLTTTGNGTFAGRIIDAPIIRNTGSPNRLPPDLGGGYRIVSGTQILTGNSTFTEPAEVLGGVLELRGSMRDVVIDSGIFRTSGLGSVAVNSLATASSSSTGTLELLSNVTVATTALINAPVTVNSSIDSDSTGTLEVVGNVNITGASLILSPTSTPGFGYDLINITGAGTLTGIFNSLPDNAIISSGGFDFRINYTPKKVTITRVLPPPPTVVVNTPLDPGNASTCSLRQALEAVALGATPSNSNCNPGAPGSIVAFDSAVFSVPQTISLTVGSLAIQTSVTINGPGARLLTIDALGSSRVFFIDDGVPSSYANVGIYGVNLVNGRAQGINAYGGAIASEENLMLGAGRIANSSATFTDAMPGLANGGAVAMGLEANLVVDDALFESNQARTAVTDSFAKGGAIYMNGGNLALSNSTLTNNTASVTGSASGSAAPAATGGAIYLAPNGTAQIGFSTLVNNSTSAVNASINPGEFESKGGGITVNNSTLAVANSVFSNQTLNPGPARTDSPDIFNEGSSTVDYSYIASPVPLVTVTNAVIGAPLLAALANNGGETNTIAFSAGSSLRDAGNPTPPSLVFDQRGPGFPRVFGSRVDVGAFELQMGALPNLSVNNVSVSGDNAANPSLDFLVTLSAASASDVSFTVNTSTSDAEAGDYAAITNQSVTILAGMTTATVSVPVTPDTIVEPTETILLTLSAPVGANISTATGTGSILNDDQAVISVSSASSALESTNATITISTSNVIEGLASVNYAAVAGTNPDPFQNATSGVDFIATPATAMLASGSVTQVIAVTDDSLVEAPEQFRVNLTSVSPPNGINPSDISLAPAASTHVHTILNNDATNLSTTAASVVEGNSGNAQLNFTVTLSVAAEAPVEVLISTANFGANTADAADYASLSNLVLNFAPGVTSKTLSVVIVGDDIVEANETLRVLLSDPALPIATITTPAVTGTITNDDSATVSISSTSVTEGNSGTTPMDFLLNLSKPVQGGVSVSFTPTNGTATAPSDFIATAGTVNFPNLSLSAARSVSIVGDTAFEPDETFSVVLGALTLPPGVSAVTLNPTGGIGTITNDDVLTNLSVNNVSISGDNAANPSLDFLVTLSAASASDVSFTVNTSTSDAEAGDYTALSNQSVTILAGMTTATVSVPITSDSIVEATETILLTLSAPVGANISTGIGTGSILNDDKAVISVSSASSALESTNATITISTSNVIEGLASVSYAAVAGTNPDPFQNAMSGVDFIATPAAAMIASGSVTQVIAVTDDSLVEAPEQLRVNLTSVSPPSGINASDISLAPAASTHVHTILNNDVTNLSTAAASVIEGSSGAAQLIFTITLSVPAAAPVQALLSTANFGTNPADAADYSSLTNLVVNFNPGVTSTTVSVEIVSDDIVEANETLRVLLSDPALPIATITTPAVTGTITNDDSATVSISSVSVIEGNSGTTPMNFLLNLSKPVQGGVSVSFTPTNGTASAPSDFIATPSTVNFPNLALNAGRSVNIVGDTVFEPNETFSVVLGALTLPPGVSAVTLSPTGGIGTITNDDVGVTTTVLSTPLLTAAFTPGITYPVAVAVSGPIRPSGSIVVSATRQGLPALAPISCALTLVNGVNPNELTGSCNLSPTSPGVWATSVSFTGTGGFSNSSASANAVFTSTLAPFTFVQSLNPTVVGQAFSVTVSASATFGGPVPTGLVQVTQFPGGISTSVPMVSGSATVNLLSRSPVVKGLQIAYTDSTGVYSAQEQFVEHVTNPAATGLSASLSAAQGGANQPVVVTYTLGVIAPGAVPPGLSGPTGQVQVSDGISSANCPLVFPTGTCSLSPSTLGMRQITARYLSNPSYLASSAPPLPYTVQQGTGNVDLTVSIGNGVRVINGSQVVYTITVRNIGDTTVGAASIANALPIDSLSQSFTCIAAAGSSCGAASGSGAIAQTIDVAPSGSVAYRVVVELAPGEAAVSNTVTVTPPPGIVDANPANNTATDIDPRGIFGSGFEDDIE